MDDDDLKVEGVTASEVRVFDRLVLFGKVFTVDWVRVSAKRYNIQLSRLDRFGNPDKLNRSYSAGGKVVRIIEPWNEKEEDDGEQVLVQAMGRGNADS